MGSPRFLWHPCAHAPLIDPGETSSPCHHDDFVPPSAVCTASALTISLLSGLIHAACSLPVYASQLGLPRYHATLGSRLVANLCRAGLSPAGSLREVSFIYMTSSSHRLCLAHAHYGMQGFRSPGAAQRFLSLHAATYNVFDTRRHLNSAANDRDCRRKAFATWREATDVAA